VLYLPAGALLDRLDRKRVMIVADAVRAATLLTVVAASLARLAWPGPGSPAAEAHQRGQRLGQ
jgi:hypothetical protein